MVQADNDPPKPKRLRQTMSSPWRLCFSWQEPLGLEELPSFWASYIKAVDPNGLSSLLFLVVRLQCCVAGRNNTGLEWYPVTGSASDNLWATCVTRALGSEGVVISSCNLLSHPQTYRYSWTCGEILNRSAATLITLDPLSSSVQSMLHRSEGLSFKN